MKQTITFILLFLICICGNAQTIDPVLLQEMGRSHDNEKIRVFVIMRQQYDQQQLNFRSAHFTTRAERREFVVNELKQFTEASQYDLRRSLEELQRNDLVSEPKVLWIANALFFEATKDAIVSLADRADILFIGFDEERNWLPDGEELHPAHPTREITSNVTQVNANQVWDLGYTGQGVVVAVIDTGVNYNHLDLADHLWNGGTAFPNHGYDIYNNDNDPMDDHGHGTHCAGTVCGDGSAGSQTGIAPDATLMCIKCLSSNGSCEDTHVIGAMQWAVDHGCDVISMSLGGHGQSVAEQTLFRNTCVNILTSGVIASIAAGNDGNKLDQYPIPENVEIPGGCPPPYLDPNQGQNPGGLSCSVCVGAVNSNDQAASFSSRGPCTWSASSYADYPYTPGSQTQFGLIRPDVCAPGVHVISADCSNNSGYLSASGTSMATPCVAGCMALMLSKNNNATPAELCRILEETAISQSTGKSNIYGYGRVDALAAVNAVDTISLSFIVFADPIVKSICLAHWDTNGDGELSYEEAAAVSNLNTYFRFNSNITSFDELQYFTRLHSIGMSAFYGCHGLTSITIPRSVTTIGDFTFCNCTGLTSIASRAETPPSLGNSAFGAVNKTIPVYVPCGRKNAYQSANGWNEFTNIQEICMQSQTITLSEGWNWFSTNLDITLNDFKATLVEALPDTSITIYSQSEGSTTYIGSRWRGTLNTLDVSQMYMIQAGTSCQIMLTDTLIQSAEHSVTIHNGANWIAFPFNESMTLNNAFAGFAANGDMVISQFNSATYLNGNWRGSCDILEPGKGYIYKSNVQGDRIFTFPISTK